MALNQKDPMLFYKLTPQLLNV